MSRSRNIALSLLMIAALVPSIGCNKVLDRFREKHPDPPAGMFPERVGKMVLDRDPRWEKTPTCTRADPLHCWAYYILPGGDNELTRTHLFIQIFDSPEEANARMIAYSGQHGTGHEKISWEDGGAKIGKVLIVNTVRPFEDGMIGFCSVSHVKDATFVTIYHGWECDPAKQFLNDLTANGN